ncbi:hypothetical protein [Aquicoccus sp. SU-CL01552]|uniref:hypothetical protein n=1 Tax=Aquicoccus sp. SU-CL01552 TaxID=3127656 RepID=UPI003102D73E
MLVLSGRDRHELSCSGCGAPLRELKMLRTDRTVSADAVPARRPKPAKRKKPKRKKGLMTRVLDEAWDLVEDIFD